jgi:DNA-binding PadR family transcriptional regulator
VRAKPGSAYADRVAKLSPMTRNEVREPTFLILASLADGKQHGYSIMREINAMSDGRVTMRAGTLYAALERIVSEGLVQESGTEVVDGRNRRYYELTDAGVDLLDSEVRRMRANASTAASRLRAREARS